MLRSFIKDVLAWKYRCGNSAREHGKRGQRLGKTEKQQNFDTASVNRSSIFVLKIYFTAGDTGDCSSVVCDDIWEFFKESPGETPYSQAGRCHPALADSHFDIGSVFVDFIFLDCGESAGLVGEVGFV